MRDNTLKEKMTNKRQPKILYFHIPKTGGSSVNDFFIKRFLNCSVHIESLSEFTSKELNKFNFISGHVIYCNVSTVINLEEWITLITLREPYSQVISHLAWVRRLAEASNKNEFNAAATIFQTVATRMLTYDFSKPNDIHSFIDWLESIQFFYFHDTQLVYLSREKDIDQAIKNLSNINYIGITENINGFLRVVSNNILEEKIFFPTKIVNENKNKYGINIHDPSTLLALDRLIHNDKILYNIAAQKSCSFSWLDYWLSLIIGVWA